MRKLKKIVPALVLACTTLFSAVVNADAGADFDTFYGDVKETSSVLLPENPGLGDEWAILTLARVGNLSDESAEAYLESAEASVSAIEGDQLEAYPTGNARVTLAVSALGKDATDFGGKNLLNGIADLDLLADQGVNAAIYALLAFDCADYEVPDIGAENPATRENLVAFILDSKLEAGGWDYFGPNPDPDLTSMAILALAPYADDENVAAEIDAAVDLLSGLQLEKGGFASWGSENACSAAQVLLALSTLGIDAASDERFEKNGATVIDALQNLFVEGEGFLYSEYSDFPDSYTTYQCITALNAYRRFLDGDQTFYDFTEKEEESESTIASETSVVSETASSSTSGTLDNAPKTGDESVILVVAGLALLLTAGIALRKENERA